MPIPTFYHGTDAVQRIDSENHYYIVRMNGEDYRVKQYPFQYCLRKPEKTTCIMPYVFTVSKLLRNDGETINVF